MRMRWTDAVKLTILIIGAIFIVAIAALSRKSVQPKRQVTGVVTAIVPSSVGRFHTPTMYVEVRAPNAMSGEVRVPFDDGRCHVGDRIKAVQSGVAIQPDPTTCISPNH